MIHLLLEILPLFNVCLFYFLSIFCHLTVTITDKDKSPSIDAHTKQQILYSLLSCHQTFPQSHLVHADNLPVYMLHAHHTP